jgi:hypothetical protein
VRDLICMGYNIKIDLLIIVCDCALDIAVSGWEPVLS